MYTASVSVCLCALHSYNKMYQLALCLKSEDFQFTPPRTISFKNENAFTHLLLFGFYSSHVGYGVYSSST